MSLRSLLPSALLAIIAGAAAPALAAERPSFDCAKAKTPVEGAICASPLLAKLDRELAAAYARAQAVTSAPVTLRATQRTFLASRGRDENGKLEKSVNVASLADSYKAQIESLNTEAGYGERARASSITPNELGRVCAVVAVEKCTVRESGAVKGSAPYGGLSYQIQVPSDEDNWIRGVVVLRNDGGRLKPVIWNFDGDIPERPEVLATPAGPLLLVPSMHGGTGAFNAELIFRPLNGGWRDLEIDAWRTAFDKQLPEELGVWKGVQYDWKTLSLDTSLWKSEDANCCPTGGSAEAKLAVEGDRLALKSMSIDRTPPREN